MCTLFFYTNAQVSSSKYNLQIINVNTENYPEAIFVEFTVTNDSGKFVSGLQEKDFIIKDNSTKKYSYSLLGVEFLPTTLCCCPLGLVDEHRKR